ncbi:MAG: hypothetical protein NC411_02880 [Bacteroides sp.]|nr:hypothetical protein [Bacteroides sp.]
MKKYFLSLGVIAAATLSLTSCLGSSSSEQTYTFTYGPNDCFNYVVDLKTGESYIGLSPTYKYEIETGSQEIDMDISNLRFNSDLSPISLRLPSMTMKINQNDGFYNISANDISPVGVGNSYVFDSFTMHFYPFRSPALYEINYVVNDRYDVTVYPTYLGYYSSVAATIHTAGSTETTFNEVDPETVYIVQVNPEKMTASVILLNAKFATDEVRENLEIRGLPVTLTDSGYRISTESGKTYDVYQYSTPQSTTPLSGYSFSNISFSAVLSTGASMNFDCTLGTTAVDSKIERKYSVRATLRYFPMNTENQ